MPEETDPHPPDYEYREFTVARVRRDNQLALDLQTKFPRPPCKKCGFRIADCSWLGDGLGCYHENCDYALMHSRNQTERLYRDRKSHGRKLCPLCRVNYMSHHSTRCIECRRDLGYKPKPQPKRAVVSAPDLVV